jgi:hypothetical protein
VYPTRSWFCKKFSGSTVKARKDMRRFLAAYLPLVLVGCGDKAKDLFDTAHLEEKRTLLIYWTNFN